MLSPSFKLGFGWKLQSSDGGSWSPSVGYWIWDSDGEMYWQSFPSPKLWSEGSQSKGDNGEKPLPWTLFSPYFIQKIAALSLFWAITFPSQMSQLMAVLQCTFSWRSLPFPVRKYGEKKEDTGMEVKLARPKGLLHVLVELQHPGEAGDKVAQGMQPRHLFKIDIKLWNCEWEDFWGRNRMLPGGREAG